MNLTSANRRRIIEGNVGISIINDYYPALRLREIVSFLIYIFLFMIRLSSKQIILNITFNGRCAYF